MSSSASVRILVLVAVAVGLAARAFAADDDRVRAAFVLNLAKYVEWPAASFEDPASPIVVGVIADPTFADVLSDTLRDKTIDARSLEIRVVEETDEARRCHIVYGGRDQRQASRKLALELRGEPVLSVAEYDRFAHVGGMVAFELRSEKISFEISRSAADRGGLKVSSKLLRLASAVR